MQWHPLARRDATLPPYSFRAERKDGSIRRSPPAALPGRPQQTSKKYAAINFVNFHRSSRKVAIALQKESIARSVESESRDAVRIIWIIGREGRGRPGRSLQRKTFEKRERNAEIYDRYLAGEDSTVLARVYGLSDRRIRDIIEHERKRRGE